MKFTDKEVGKVYNKIAEGFYYIRQRPITDEVEKLAKEWKPGKILDIGCGIGSSLLPFATHGFECHGLDIAPNMIKFAKEFSKKHNVKFKLKKASILKMPFKEASYDYVISTAVLHHLDSKKKRLKALKEIKRILKPKGHFFLSVKNDPDLYGDDSYLPWNHHGKEYRRYYHFFSKNELKDLLKASRIKANIYLDEKNKNICIIGNL